jgi:hypothetical protein
MQKNSFLSFPFLLIGRDHPPARPGRSSTPIFILRMATGTLWEGPGDLSHCLPVISGPPARKNFSSPFRVKNETRCTQNQRFYSGLRTFNWYGTIYYLSPTPQGTLYCGIIPGAYKKISPLVYHTVKVKRLHAGCRCRNARRREPRPP